MEFKVGQRVKVKQLTGNSNCEVTDLFISSNMEKYSGELKTIKLKANNDTFLLHDCDGYWFSIYMLIPIKARIKRK